jgi:hypothetical protein
MKSHAKFKFNGGIGALVCSKCSRIIKEGNFFTEEEWKACRGEIKLPGQLCDICEEEKLYKDE